MRSMNAVLLGWRPKRKAHVRVVTAFQNIDNFVTPHLPVSFGRDTKSRWSLLSGVYAGGCKRSHTG